MTVVKKDKPKKKYNYTKKTGKPAMPFDDELMKKMCFELSIQPHGIDRFLKNHPEYPSRDTIYKWLYEYRNFAEWYRDAKVRQQDFLVDYQEEEIAIARSSTYTDDKGTTKIDPSAVALAKLACDNIKWQAARVSATKYGPNVTINSSSVEGVKESEKKIRELIKQHAKDY